MAYCGPRGIPRSTFLAWPDDDQDAALAWAQLQRDVCAECGTEPAEFDESVGGDRFAYVVERRLCPGCELLEQERAALREESRDNERVAFGAQMVLVPRALVADVADEDDD